jgi:predicted N-acyltransferase
MQWHWHKASRYYPGYLARRPYASAWRLQNRENRDPAQAKKSLMADLQQAFRTSDGVAVPF